MVMLSELPQAFMVKTIGIGVIPIASPRSNVTSSTQKYHHILHDIVGISTAFMVINIKSGEIPRTSQGMFHYNS